MWGIPVTVKRLAQTLAFSIPAGLTIIDVVGYVARVEGCSMQPVLNPLIDDRFLVTDYVFLYNWPIATNSFKDIRRGDIVALVSPTDPKQRLIKRVVGLEGDIIETKGFKERVVRVPSGHAWIEGDNHYHSLDSNAFGPVALGLVKSKAKFIVWPPSRVQILNPDTTRPSKRRDALLLEEASGTIEKLL